MNRKVLSLFFIMLSFMIISACSSAIASTPAAAPASVPSPLPPTPTLTSALPASVEGMVIDRSLPDLTVGPLERTYRLTVRTNAGDLTVPVTIEVFRERLIGTIISLDCSQSPCVKAKTRLLLTGTLMKVPQDSWTLTLDIDGEQRILDVDPAWVMYFWQNNRIGQTITLDCTDLPCEVVEQ